MSKTHVEGSYRLGDRQAILESIAGYSMILNPQRQLPVANRHLLDDIELLDGQGTAVAQPSSHSTLRPEMTDAGRHWTKVQ